MNKEYSNEAIGPECLNCEKFSYKENNKLRKALYKLAKEYQKKLEPVVEHGIDIDRLIKWAMEEEA